MPSPVPTPRPSRPAWICVIETGDDRRPRKSRDKPRIRVARTGTRPGPELDAWLPKSRSLEKLGATRVRYDLMLPDDEPGGRDRPFRVPEDATQVRAALKALRQKLSGEGYTVNGDTTTWSVYVIELHPPKRPDPKVRPTGYLYVGQTSIAVEERARQHELGPCYPWKGKPKHSKSCHERFKALRMDLLPTEYAQPFYSRESALCAESRLRIHFERLHHAVIGGQERYPKKTSTCPAGPVVVRRPGAKA